MTTFNNINMEVLKIEETTGRIMKTGSFKAIIMTISWIKDHHLKALKKEQEELLKIVNLVWSKTTFVK
jgi:hypothetical protein